MFNFFARIKNTGLNIVSIILNITTLIYLVSLFGFNHINKELLIDAFTGMSIAAVIISLAVLTISFIFYASFKLAYKKILTNLEILTKTMNDTEKR